MTRILAALALWFSVTGLAQAHVTELAVLKITEIADGRYSVSWAMRPNTELGDDLEPIFPPHCDYTGAMLDCGSEGLAGTLGFELIGAGQSAALFKIRTRDGETQVYTVTPSDPTVEVSRSFDATSWAGILDIGSAYLAIGFQHILQGIDHLLFVLGLVWIARGSWMLFKTITAFTVAHSITLGAVTFGLVGVPELFVNVMIALSIVFIGVEILKAQRAESTFTLRFPWVVAFLFGLLHGFGFANALVALGLPESARPLALLAFNVGVELGQIVFVFGILALAWAYRVMLVTWPAWSRPMPAYAIGGIAAFWFFDRTAALMGA